MRCLGRVASQIGYRGHSLLDPVQYPPQSVVCLCSLRPSDSFLVREKSITDTEVKILVGRMHSRRYICKLSSAPLSFP